MSKYLICFLVMSICIIFMISISTPMSARENKDSIVINSPSGEVKGVIDVKDDGQLVYTVKAFGNTVIETSDLGIHVDGLDLGHGVEVGQPKKNSFYETYPWIGGHSVAIDHHNLVKIPVSHKDSGIEYFLEIKAYDDGLAFRYVVPGEGVRTVSGETTSFRLPTGSTVWYQTNVDNYEGKYERQAIDSIATGTKIGPPMTIQLPNQTGYAAISEGALLDYSGMSLLAENDQTFKANFVHDTSWQIEGTIETPWRIILISLDLNGLVNSDIVNNQAPPPSKDLVNADWIRPHKTTWSWLGGGGVTVENMKRYIDLAAELGIESNLVDDGWSHWTEGDPWDLLAEVVAYGQERNVDTWVWKAAPDNFKGIPGIYDRESRREFFKKVHELGAVGVKIDFMDSERTDWINFYRDTLEDAAEFELMINFHGANKPTGLSRTYPHEMSREGIRGLEQSAPWADHNTVLPFTRLLAGHADFTPLNFTERLADTTWSHQIGTAITYTSPQLVLGEHPENILNNPAVELVKSMPSTWDETVVLPVSEIGEVSALARRKGTTWFIAILNNSISKRVDIDLSFLGEGNYQAKIYSDDLEQPAAYTIEEKTLSKVETLKVNMRSGGGFVAKLSKLDMESYGGGFAFAKKIYLSSVDSNAQIHYTLDGSEPTDESPLYENFISINHSAIVRAKIIEGDGQGSEVTGRFNKISPRLSIKHDGNGKWVTRDDKISFDTNVEDVDYEIRYTLDGSDPDKHASLYTAPFSIRGSATIKARLYIEGFDERIKAEETLFVNPPPLPPLPDVQLSDLEWESATTGWKEVQKDKSVEGNPLRIRGKEYEKGIGTHANSKIVFNILPGVKRFVSVVGVDDEAEDEGKGASIVFKVYADETLLAESPILNYHHYWHLDVALPEDANQLVLVLEDAGDGKNYDHGDWVNAGFVYKTEVTIADINRYIGYYEQVDEIDPPLVVQLTNILKQAENMLEKGREFQAMKKMEDFLKGLNNPAMDKFITTGAKKVLNNKVNDLLTTWGVSGS